MNQVFYPENKKNIIIAGLFFFLSVIITWWFITASPLYISNKQKILSCGIAGGKWLLQITAALIFLQSRKWVFVRNISVTCLIGSAILLPFCISSVLKLNSSNTFFILSIIAAVLVMIFSYYKSVLNAGIGLKWWLGWILCLAIAIVLQLTIVFHIIN